MHYFGAVIVPAGTSFADVKEHVGLAMEPHRENYDGDGPATGFWDWWQIGGRWTGVWSGYKPHEDETLTRTCILCHGTGRRDDAVARRVRAMNPEYTCNGCDGTGREPLHPTQYPEHNGDMIPVQHLIDNPDLRRPHTLVVADGPVLEKESWNGEDFIATEDFDARVEKTLVEYAAAQIVVVDFHS